MSEYLIEMRNITKKFPGIVANDDVTIKIKKGEIYALLGENGAGKSTLMSMLFGMYEPDDGEIYIDGKKENINSPETATKLNIGMVHQHFKLIQNYTVAENIILGLHDKGKKFGFLPWVDLKSANKKVHDISIKYGLEVNPTAKISELNVSEQQRVEILKMLYREADILIFDEPTAVLTPQEIDFLITIIKELRSQGKTIILITHKLEEIKQVADRCAILQKGKLIEVLDVETSSTNKMAQLMVGEEVIFEVEKQEPSFGQTILKVDNLTVKNKNKFDVVKNVSFSIRAGEIFAIAGVSGNGQVEIADTIAGLSPSYSGTITFNDIDITNSSIKNRIESGIAYIPEDRQKYGLVLDSSLEDNMVLKTFYKEPNSKSGIINQDEITKKTQYLIDKYDVRSGQGPKTTVRSMSGGNQQKAIIAREVELDNTKLLIFVQPTRGLDVGAISNIQNQIIQERDAGKAILLISLELDEIMNLADTIGVIYSGSIDKIATANSLTTTEIGEFMMGVEKNENI